MSGPRYERILALLPAEPELQVIPETTWKYCSSPLYRTRSLRDTYESHVPHEHTAYADIPGARVENVTSNGIIGSVVNPDGSLCFDRVDWNFFDYLDFDKIPTLPSRVVGTYPFANNTVPNVGRANEAFSNSGGANADTISTPLDSSPATTAFTTTSTYSNGVFTAGYPANTTTNTSTSTKHKPYSIHSAKINSPDDVYSDMESYHDLRAGPRFCEPDDKSPFPDYPDDVGEDELDVQMKPLARPGEVTHNHTEYAALVEDSELEVFAEEMLMAEAIQSALDVADLYLSTHTSEDSDSEEELERHVANKLFNESTNATLLSHYMPDLHRGVNYTDEIMEMFSKCH